MYDELVKRLRSEADFPYNDNRNLMRQAADAIEELDMITDNLNYLYKTEVPKWIPVTERPPQKEGIYWCYTNQGAMCECRWANDRYGLGASDMWGWNIMDVPQYQKITHWMPLPQPPKEG